MASVRTKIQGGGRIAARLREFKNADGMRASVGILDDHAQYPDGTKVADVMKWINHGTKDMVPRRFLQRARAQGQKKARKAIQKAIKAGKPTVEILSAGAIVLADEIVRQIDTAQRWAPPLEPSTIKKKGHAVPLDDTGRLRRAQEWDVKTKNGRVIARGRPAR